MAYPTPVTPISSTSIPESTDFISSLRVAKFNWTLKSIRTYLFGHRYHFVVMNSTPEQWNEKIEWCRENFKPSKYKYQIMTHPKSDVLMGRIFFKKREDALLFKLTWA